MNAQIEKIIRERTSMLLIDGVSNALYDVLEVGALIAEIDALRDDLRKLADCNNYEIDESEAYSEIYWYPQDDPETTPWAFAASALKRSESETR